MGAIPEAAVKEHSRISIYIPVPPWLLDHRDSARAVLPATFALHELAQAVGGKYTALRDASFLRFLVLPDTGAAVGAEVECEPLSDGGIRASLVTVRRAGGMTRRVEHVVARFVSGDESPRLPTDLAAVPEGPGLRMNPAEIYQELVPFGPAFQNLKDPVWVTPGGATSGLTCPGYGGGNLPLGSPFALDAAFHLCCVWSQRFFGVTTFPVGFAYRRVVAPARPGAKLRVRIVPRASTIEACNLAPVTAAMHPESSANEIAVPPPRPSELLFDLWLYDQRNRLREVCIGLRMLDVSRGRLPVPDWVRCKAPSKGDRLRAHCQGLALYELDALPQELDGMLTRREGRRWRAMGPLRRRTFLGSRIALKGLARRLDPASCPADPRRIDTLDADGIRPRCHRTKKAVAVAHDARWVIAVAGDHPIGVDVEPIDERALRGMRMFLDEREQALVHRSRERATRFWTIKEAAAKALNIGLAKAWGRVRVEATTSSVSVVVIDGVQVDAWHEVIDEHVFTVIQLPEDTA